MTTTPFARAPRGLTLIELVVVLAVLVIVAGIALTRSEAIVDDARATSAVATLRAVRDAIDGDAGYVADVRSDPRQIADLLRAPLGVPTYDALAHEGWRGPYLAWSGARYDASEFGPALGFVAAYATDGGPTVFDSWRRPLVLQPAPGSVADALRSQFLRIVSAGPDGRIDVPAAALDFDPTDPSIVHDDVVLFVRHVHDVTGGS